MTMHFDSIQELVKEEIVLVHDMINQQFTSDVPLVNEIAGYVTKSQGKMIRPLMILLIAKSLNRCTHQHIQLSTIVEFIHTATLLHDDVVDNSIQRRGQEATHVIFGNQAAVLIGDFLYTRAFQLMTELEQHSIMVEFAKTTNTLSEGEILQLMHCGNLELSQAEYMNIIYNKTACLFECCGKLSAWLSFKEGTIVQSCAQYAKEIGYIFQLVDDLLDYVGDTNMLGKNIGDDLSEGKLTLPIIYALSHLPNNKHMALRDIIQYKQVDKLEQLLDFLSEAGSFVYIKQLAQEKANKAKQLLQSLPRNVYTQALYEFIELLLLRVV